LRRGDLLCVSWSHVGENEIVIPTSKSGKRVEARIPLYDELREVLARIPKRSTTILTNSKGRPWTGDGFGTMITKTKAKAGIGDELHFNDLRGTAATRFYVAGLDKRVIAEILGWTEKNVENIIRKYVGRDAATKAVIRQLNEKRKT
jgi:integrase